MVKRLKKAFTITELVIVIAVVAILAAVLIPTFANIIDKANESADTQTVANLNKILASEQTIGGRPAANMSEALEQAQEGGYSVEKLSPTGENNYILWEQESNRFVLADKKGNILYKDSLVEGDVAAGSNFWKMTASQDEINSGKYSYYLQKDFPASSLTVTTGIDVGENTGIDIKYDRSSAAAGQTVIFNTAEGTLIVDAPLDTVYHYGTAQRVDVTAVDPNNSYHLFAQISGNVTIKSGHFVAENGGSAAALLITAEDGNDVSVLLGGGSQIPSVAAQNGDVAAALSQIVVDNTGAAVMVEGAVSENKDFAGGFGTEAAPYLISSAEEFMNISSDQKVRYYRLTADIDLEGVESNSKNLLTYFYGQLDGDGHRIIAPKNRSVYLWAYALNAHFLDFTIVQRGSSDYSATGYLTLAQAVCYYKSYEVIFENITVEGETEDTLVSYGYNDSAFSGGNGVYGGSIRFINCVNKVDGMVLNYDGVFVGGHTWSNAKVGNSSNNANIAFINCRNEGNVFGNCVSLFTGNVSNGGVELVDSLEELENFYNTVENPEEYPRVPVYVENCSNSGSIAGSAASSPFASYAGESPSSVNDEANAALSETNANGTARFTGAACVKVTAAEASGTVEGDRLVIAAEETAGEYMLQISAYISVQEPGKDARTTRVIFLLRGKVENGSAAMPYLTGVELQAGEAFDAVQGSGENLGYSEANRSSFKYVKEANGWKAVVKTEDALSPLTSLTEPLETYEIEIISTTYAVHWFTALGQYLANGNINVQAAA